MTEQTTESADTTPAAEPPKKHQGSFLRELPFLLLIALVLALLIKTFVLQAFYIPSASMEQTLLVGDRVLVNKLVYRFRDVNRGEIVVFDGEDSFSPEVRIPPPANKIESVRRKIQDLVGFSQLGERDFIKRVVGIPGDTIACCTNGHVTVNGTELKETYIYEDDRATFGPQVVPPGRVFVMGDHRGRSTDSRLRGPVPIDKIIGRAFVVIWPPSHAKGLRVPPEIEKSGIPEKALSYVVTPPVLGFVGALPVTALRRRRRLARSSHTVAR